MLRHWKGTPANGCPLAVDELLVDPLVDLQEHAYVDGLAALRILDIPN
jgi:hypothetical protein